MKVWRQRYEACNEAVDLSRCPLGNGYALKVGWNGVHLVGPEGQWLCDIPDNLDNTPNYCPRTLTNVRDWLDEVRKEIG